MKDKITIDRATVEQALDALLWTTGSSDFGEGGQAREGALACLFPAIDALRQAARAGIPAPTARETRRSTMVDNTGGPAFPNAAFGGTRNEQQGMTLRDYFAAKAMHVAWEAYDKGYTGSPENVTNSIAEHAYQLADAMLRAREAA